ncbi:MAG: recombinase family protein [Thermoplasmatota archaeon]
MAGKTGYRDEKGGSWDKKTVSRILSNPVYCGLLEWKEIVVPGEHRAVVPRELFNEVQREKHRRARRKGSNFVIRSNLKKSIL